MAPDTFPRRLWYSESNSSSVQRGSSQTSCALKMITVDKETLRRSPASALQIFTREASSCNVSLILVAISGADSSRYTSVRWIWAAFYRSEMTRERFSLRNTPWMHTFSRVNWVTSFSFMPMRASADTEFKRSFDLSPKERMTAVLM